MDIDDPQRHTLGGDGKERVDEEAPAVRVVERAAPLDLFVGSCEVVLGGILGEDDNLVLADALHGGVVVWREQDVGGDTRVIDEFVGGFDLVTAVASSSELQRRLEAEAVEDEAIAGVETLVAEVGAVEFFSYPGLHGSP